MRIVEGSPSAGTWPRIYDCLKCKAKLEIEAIDVTQPGQREGDEGWFRCLVCGHVNHLSKQETQESQLAVQISQAHQQFR